jgi:hypothetical protein
MTHEKKRVNCKCETVFGIWQLKGSQEIQMWSRNISVMKVKKKKYFK